MDDSLCLNPLEQVELSDQMRLHLQLHLRIPQVPAQVYRPPCAFPASAAVFAAPRSAAYFVPATCAEHLLSPEIVGGFGQKFADFPSGSRKIPFHDHEHIF